MDAAQKVFITLGMTLLLGSYVLATIAQADNAGVAVPTNNGTASQLNVTSRMQQYIGFYGIVQSVVRLNTSNSSGVLYQRNVTQGKIYFAKAGATLTAPLSYAPNNTYTDGNFSLTGYYVTGNHFVTNSTTSAICGITYMDFLNTTDNFAVGILKDAAASPNYMVCTDIRTVASSNGFGTVSYEVIAPKTGAYSAYDVYVDLE